MTEHVMHQGLDSTGPPVTTTLRSFGHTDLKMATAREMDLIRGDGGHEHANA